MAFDLRDGSDLVFDKIHGFYGASDIIADDSGGSWHGGRGTSLAHAQ